MAEPRKPAGAAHEESRTYSVLLIEDDPHTAELLAYNLSAAGYQVFTVASGPAALKHLEIVMVDLIISDVMMADMDGFALRERLLQDPVMREIPFIFLTAKTQPEDQVRGLSTGADEYITKPFDPQVLIARVNAVMRRRENFARVARLDPLTGLLNRAALERDVERELARIKRYPSVGALAFLDIDGFKQVNDLFGHSAGDRALTLLASVLTKDIRSVDLVGRYGGEEFVLYFPETPEDDAKSILERMLNQFQGLSAGDTTGPLTFSAGIVEAPRDGTNFKLLTARADSAMYVAKRQGKSQIVVWRPEMAPENTGAAS